MKRASRVLRPIAATALSGALLLSWPAGAVADQVRDGQWANKAFDLPKVWSVSRGDGVTVAVIDDGVDATQADLAGQVLPGYDPDGQGRDHRPGADSHGTQMASLIAGHGHGPGGKEGVVGLAPGARILPLFKEKGGADAMPEDIRWAVDHGAKVVNISQGLPDQTAPDLPAAVAYAAAHDVLVVASAGNSGRSVASPANEPGVLAVGAVDQSLAVWSKSNFGPELLLTAPGVGVVAAGNGSKYEIEQGTSGAAAYVSAAAALVRAKFPDLTAGQVANRLVRTALVPSGLVGASLPDSHYGYGIVRPYQALTQEVGTGTGRGPLAPLRESGTPGPAAAVAQPPRTGPGRGLPVVAVAVGAAVVAVVALLVVALAVGRRSRRPAPPAPAWQPAGAPYGPPPVAPQQGHPDQPWQGGGAPYR
ncbi:S8 family serine peptidase [Kitasatospora sp. NPDC002227]|uniref:S8 family serine peptidase n=1 Tax=Kitasatospora sp. NPDC002227 TaxID=3154773 RepID=UPI00333069E7